MDIDLLSKMVKELVMDNDRVALPGLGTFVVETVPAAFTDKGYTVNPPYRKLSFRPIMQKDSLLVDLYASANNVSKDIAQKALTSFIEGLREVLQSRKNVVFPGLGRLRATKENNFFFVADEDLDIYPEGFGLAPLSLKTHVETKEEVSAAMDALKVMIDDAPEDAEFPADENLAAEQPAVLMPESEPVQTEQVEPEPEPESESGSEPEPEYEPSESADSDLLLPVEPAEVEEEVAELETETGIPESEDRETGGRKWRKVMFIALIVLSSLVLLTLIYVVVARLFPDFIDNILYNAEEYNILHRT